MLRAFVLAWRNTLYAYKSSTFVLSIFTAMQIALSYCIKYKFSFWSTSSLLNLISILNILSAIMSFFDIQNEYNPLIWESSIIIPDSPDRASKIGLEMLSMSPIASVSCLSIALKYQPKSTQTLPKIIHLNFDNSFWIRLVISSLACFLDCREVIFYISILIIISLSADSLTR